MKGKVSLKRHHDVLKSIGYYLRCTILAHETIDVHWWWLRSPGVVWYWVRLRSEFGDSLGSLRDGVLGQLSRQDKPDCCLDLPGCYCGLLSVPSQAGCLIGNLLKDVIDEGVQDWHCLGADAGVWMNLQWNNNDDGDGHDIEAKAMHIQVSRNTSCSARIEQGFGKIVAHRQLHIYLKGDRCHTDLTDSGRYIHAKFTTQSWALINSRGILQNLFSKLSAALLKAS